MTLSPASEAPRTYFLFSLEEPSLPSSADCPTCVPCPAGPPPSQPGFPPALLTCPLVSILLTFLDAGAWEGRKAKQAPPSWRNGKGWVLRRDKTKMIQWIREGLPLKKKKSALEFQGLNKRFHQQSRELASTWWLVERSLQNSAAAIYVTGLFLSVAPPRAAPQKSSLSWDCLTGLW